jgi:hypothetical protein
MRMAGMTSYRNARYFPRLNDVHGERSVSGISMATLVYVKISCILMAV